MAARLLTGVGPAAMTLDRHRQVHGELPVRDRRSILDEITRSGLRGRGGAAFPLALKLDAVARARGRPVVVANGCEGEPMSVKDRLLLCSLPHLVIDGALTVAQALGASELVIAVDELDVRSLDTLQRALDERPDLRRERTSASVVAVPSGYVSGQERALVHWCNDGIAMPTAASPPVFTRGIDRRPTLVSNVETLAHVALIARHGGDWFRGVGTPEDPGTALVTVSGAVRRPATVEVEHGASLASVIEAVGGPAEPLRALLVGGYAGAWIDAAELPRIRLDGVQLGRFDARLGAGIVVALGASACPVAEVARVAGWLSDASTGQCGPCVNGLASIAAELARVRDGVPGHRPLARIERWGRQAARRGACAHPDGAVSFVASAMRVFTTEMADHIANGPCEGCGAPGVLVAHDRRIGVG